MTDERKTEIERQVRSLDNVTLYVEASTCQCTEYRADVMYLNDVAVQELERRLEQAGFLPLGWREQP